MMAPRRSTIAGTPGSAGLVTPSGADVLRRRIRRSVATASAAAASGEGSSSKKFLLRRASTRTARTDPLSDGSLTLLSSASEQDCCANSVRDEIKSLRDEIQVLTRDLRVVKTLLLGAPRGREEPSPDQSAQTPVRKTASEAGEEEEWGPPSIIRRTPRPDPLDCNYRDGERVATTNATTATARILDASIAHKRAVDPPDKTDLRRSAQCWSLIRRLMWAVMITVLMGVACRATTTLQYPTPTLSSKSDVLSDILSGLSGLRWSPSTPNDCAPVQGQNNEVQHPLDSGTDFHDSDDGLRGGFWDRRPRGALVGRSQGSGATLRPSAEVATSKASSKAPRSGAASQAGLLLACPQRGGQPLGGEAENKNFKEEEWRRCDRHMIPTTCRDLYKGKGGPYNSDLWSAEKNSGLTRDRILWQRSRAESAWLLAMDNIQPTDARDRHLPVLWKGPTEQRAVATAAEMGHDVDDHDAASWHRPSMEKDTMPSLEDGTKLHHAQRRGLSAWLRSNLRRKKSVNDD